MKASLLAVLSLVTGCDPLFALQANADAQTASLMGDMACPAVDPGGPVIALKLQNCRKTTSSFINLLESDVTFDFPADGYITFNSNIDCSNTSFDNHSRRSFLIQVDCNIALDRAPSIGPTHELVLEIAENFQLPSILANSNIERAVSSGATIDLSTGGQLYSFSVNSVGPGSGSPQSRTSRYLLDLSANNLSGAKATFSMSLTCISFPQEPGSAVFNGLAWTITDMRLKQLP